MFRGEYYDTNVNTWEVTQKKKKHCAIVMVFRRLFIFGNIPK